MMPKITLKAARVNAGMTQEDVAREMHRTKQTIVNWEAGVTAIRPNDLQALSDLYAMPIEYINIPKLKRRDAEPRSGRRKKANEDP